MELDFVDNSVNVGDSTVKVVGGISASVTSWGRIRHLGNGTGPNHGLTLSAPFLVQSIIVATPLLVPGPFCRQETEHQSQCRGRLSRKGPVCQ